MDPEGSRRDPALVPSGDPDSLLLDRIRELGFVSVSNIWDEIRRDPDKVIAEKGVETFTEPYKSNKLAGAVRIWKLYNGDGILDIERYLKVFGGDLREDVAEFIKDNKDDLLEILDFRMDFTYGNFAAATMINNYLSKSSRNTEIPQFMIMRVAVGASWKRGLPFVKRTISLFNQRLLSLASPTIYNMGFKKGAPTSCMVITMEDDLGDIYDVLKEIAMASKNNAGIGIALNRIRHSSIGKQGESKGIMPLLTLLDDSIEYVNQGGRRPGAATATLPVWHYDIQEFIGAVDKVKADRVKRLNTSVVVNDLFMERVQEDGYWYCMCPNQTGNLSTSSGGEFRRLYEKLEERAEGYIAWERYKYLHKIWEGARMPEDEAEELISLMRRFESKEYCDYWRYKYLGEGGDKFQIMALIEEKRKLEETAKSGEAKREEMCRLEELRGRLDGLNINIPEEAPPPEDFRCVRYRARDILSRICDQQRKSGMPYVMHGDTVNEKNPNDNVGFIYSLNLCQEIALPATPKKYTATCNIASVCLKDMVRVINDNVEFDYEKLSGVVRDLVILLNDVMDSAENIQEKAKASNEAIRPIGIGVNGWAELMHKLDMTVVDISSVDFTIPETERYKMKRGLKMSKSNLELIRRVWSCIYYSALDSSCQEAKRAKPYGAFESSKYKQGKLHFSDCIGDYSSPADPSLWGASKGWRGLVDDIKEYGLRNSTVTAQMPTATSAQILEASEATEFSNNLIVRRVKTGDFVVQNYHLVEDLRKIGLWNRETHNHMLETEGSILGLPEGGLSNGELMRLRKVKEKYRTIWEIPQKFRIEEEGVRQIFTDQARSFNIYLVDPRKEVLMRVHHDIWKAGLKASYYVRSKASMKNIRFGKREQERTCDESCLSCSL